MFNIGNFLPKRAAGSKSRSLLGACLTHILHDGYTDQLYALLPVWQAQFGLSYMGLAMVRALYYGTMGGLQVPADRWTNMVEAAMGARVIDIRGSTRVCRDGAADWIRGSVRGTRAGRSRIKRATFTGLAFGDR